MNITPQNYITDSSNTPVAVILDIATFHRIEEALENYALAEMMRPDSEDNSANELLSLEDAKQFYHALPKAL